jgi:hypothetical protein
LNENEIDNKNFGSHARVRIKARQCALTQNLAFPGEGSGIDEADVLFREASAQESVKNDSCHGLSALCGNSLMEESIESVMAEHEQKEDEHLQSSLQSRGREHDQECVISQLDGR